MVYGFRSKIAARSSGDTRKFVCSSSCNARRRSMRPSLAPRSNTPSVPLTSKPRGSATRLPSASSMSAVPILNSSANWIASRSPRSSRSKAGTDVGPLARTRTGWMRNPFAHDLRCLGMFEFPQDSRRDKNLFKENGQKIYRVNLNQVIQWRSIGNSNHCWRSNPAASFSRSSTP